MVLSMVLKKKNGNRLVSDHYKFNRNLDKSGWNIELYFTDFASNKDSGSVNENEYNVKISGLKNRINIIKTNLLYTSKFHKIFNLIKRIKNTIYYVLLCIKLKPDLIYIDRAHAFEGALISRFLKKKVFLRMMGVAVYNQEKIENLKKNKIKFSFFVGYSVHHLVMFYLQMMVPITRIGQNFFLKRMSSLILLLMELTKIINFQNII